MKEVAFKEALAVWIRIGLLSFGGPAGQIALMHKILVEEKKWVEESRFLHALNYCMLLPGPEAQQLATYIGWLLHGVKGGLVAGILFILPGALAIFGLSWVYVAFGDVPAIEGVFFGLKAAVLAIVVQAMIRIAAKTLKTPLSIALACSGFVALFAFALPFPLVVLGAGCIGYFIARIKPTQDVAATSAADSLQPVVRPGTRTAALICLVLWLIPVAALSLTLGTDHVFAQIALFFSKMAVVTFGGAYAVLAYVAQQGVENFEWLLPGEMLEGLALAETTPGPLILVTQFVGFLAAYRQAAPEPSIWYATLGAGLTLWVTFLPCFVWIFAGAPYVEKLRSNTYLSAALSAITAVVVGVIANLAVWFATNTLFQERTVNLPMLALTLLSFYLLFRLRIGMLYLLASAAGLGATWTLLS